MKKWINLVSFMGVVGCAIFFILSSVLGSTFQGIISSHYSLLIFSILVVTLVITSEEENHG